MKKILLALLCAFFCVLGMARPKAGIVGGFTSSQMKLKDVNMRSATGYFAGLTFKNDLALGFAIQPGVIYNKKKSEGDSDISLSYVEIPLQIQWGPDLILFRPYVFAEPFVGAAVGNGMIYNELSSTLAYGLGLGGGVEIRDTLQLSFKYYWNFEDCGLSEFYSQARTAISDRTSFCGLAISLAFLF